MQFKPRPWSPQPVLTPVVLHFLQSNLLLECSPPIEKDDNTHYSGRDTGTHDPGPTLTEPQLQVNRLPEGPTYALVSEKYLQRERCP